MRIGMLLMGGVYPPDIRVAKEAKLLRSVGHEVRVLTSDKDGAAAREDVEGVEVVRYAHQGPWLSRKAGAVTNLATWYQPVWASHIKRFVLEGGIDVVHCHDLNAVKSAHRIARSEGVPLVYDMHENYAHVVASWHRGAVARTVQTPSRYERYERWAVRSADHVVVVSDEMRARVLDLGARPDRVIRFANVDDYESDVVWAGPFDSFEVAFAGGFTSKQRGVHVLIEAFPDVLRTRSDARLLLMGSGPLEDGLHDLVRTLGIQSAVEFTGWVSEDEMRRRLLRASVGVIPFLSTEQTQAALPHKLFQYLALGLPTVVTDCQAMRSIIDATGAGTVARAGDPKDLARAILALADPVRAVQASRAALAAHRERFSLAAEGSALVGLYQELEGAGRGRRSSER